MSEDIDSQNEEKELPVEQIKEVLENTEISEEDKEQIISRIISIKQSFSGPLPPPEVLGRYSEVVENGAERIMRKFEKQTDHRMELENFAIKNQIKQSGRGQNFGFLIVLLCIGCTVFFAMEGFVSLAIAFGTTTILGLASIFVLGKLLQSKDKDEK